MSASDKISGIVWEDGDVSCLARVQLNGSNVTQSVLSSITCKVFDLNSSTRTTAVSTPTVTIASSVFDTLQTDGRWTVDATGYNFRHTIAASVISSAHRYKIEYLFTGTGGEKFFVVFEASAQEVYTS